MVAVSSWGRLTSFEHQVSSFADADLVPSVINANAPGIAYGMGRSYGDVCLNPDGHLWSTKGLDRFISFDKESGLLVCQAGVLLRDIQRIMLSYGWMLPVTPGTQMVTVGGAIACDVHGKNHHVRGTFGEHIQYIKLVRTDGQIIVCSPHEHPQWFAATVGGIGLTGVIVEAAIQLRPVKGPWIDAENLPFANLDEFFTLSDESEADWENTVSWIDCVSGGGGRGIFMRGNQADIPDRQEPKTRIMTIPVVPPISAVNGLSLRLFNFAYYNMKKMKAGREIVHYQPFFYPLDNLLEWNKMYGPRGFYQYQSVVPRSVGKDAIQTMLNEIAKSGNGSFLAVLKTFGNRESVGMLSFPQPGVTLALDFPNRGAKTQKLFERLNSIVSEAGGRLYAAKDASMPRELFEAGYPRLAEFLKYRDQGISSAMSRRLIGS
ncbi:FAD-binding oxidoreductase [Escherichia coli]|uniref:FAD-binding oxidoreductase n=1 Tax=Citrobacter sp. Cb016 TaxID=2985015 RepID=UPI00257DB80A|nr:FAD-binding oxidoreductase [Citrobacter sp. Cb016]ELX9580990.1 FAD-binding oxidoreductase [Escherichia coli]MDM3397784.1 FAD-binding oxidoreductase [Citrobacter sp. Cb016]